MGAMDEISFLKSVGTRKADMDDVEAARGIKRKRGRPPNPRRGSLHSKNSITTDSPRSESTKNSDSSSATEEETCFTLRLVLPCNACGEPSTEHRLVVICDQCKKGYHQMCHSPRIPQSFLEDTERVWRCRVCVPQGSVRKSAKNFRANTRALYSRAVPLPMAGRNLDIQRSGSSPHRYCYCGRNEVWEERMLQCRKCLEWYHEKCVSCLEWPLAVGDNFYNFRCSICTQGPETIQRLPLSWVDVTEIVLYQLHKNWPDTDSFGINSEILPHLDSIWNLLQVPPELNSCSLRERHSHVLYCLRHVPSRYRSVESTSFEGPSFALLDPHQIPALSAQHWHYIRESLAKEDFMRADITDSLDLYGGSRSDDDCSSSTITTSSATSIASEGHFDIFEECRVTQGVNIKKEENDAVEENEAMRKKLRPRAPLPQNSKNRRGKKQANAATVKKEELHDEPTVTASLSRIPIPENFTGVNNPFHEVEEDSPLNHTNPCIDEQPRASIRKRKLQPRDLVITKDGTIRCKRIRRRHSGFKSTPSSTAADCSNHGPNPNSESINGAATALLDSKLQIIDSMIGPGKVDVEQSAVNDRCGEMKFEGEKSLFQIAFQDSVMASRLLDNGSMQILLKRK